MQTKKYDIEVIKNKSTTYFLPLVDTQVNFKFRENILNTYLSFQDGDEIFCILYGWSSDPKFLKYEGELMKNHLYLGHSDYGNKVVYKFRLPLLMLKEREKFINGRVKDYSLETKGAIIRYLQETNTVNWPRIQNLMNPEVEDTSPPPDMVKETLSNHVNELVVKIDSFI